MTEATGASLQRKRLGLCSSVSAELFENSYDVQECEDTLTVQLANDSVRRDGASVKYRA